MPWTQLLISLLVFAGTTLQALLAMFDMYVANGTALEVWEAESDLIDEQPLSRRRTVARELRSMRDDKTHAAIETMKLSIVAWWLLSFASLIAVVASVMQLAA